MALYGFAYSEDALKFLQTWVPVKVRGQIRKRIESLASNTTPPGSKKLHGVTDGDDQSIEFGKEIIESSTWYAITQVRLSFSTLVTERMFIDEIEVEDDTRRPAQDSDDAIKHALTVKPPPEGWQEYEKTMKRERKRRRSKRAA